LDTLGNILWDRYIVLPDTNLSTYGIVTAVNKDSSFVMVSWGSLYSPNPINAILQTDKLGNVEWWERLPGRPLSNSSFIAQSNLLMEKDGYVIGLYKQIDNIKNIGITRTEADGTIVGIDKKPDIIPERVTLYQNYPNPFNASTKISFRLPTSEEVELSIYNILGKKITTLVHQKFAPGLYHIIWNADQFSSGIYFYRLKISADQILTKRMLLVK
jgi:hypothetical protein